MASTSASALGSSIRWGISENEKLIPPENTVTDIRSRTQCKFSNRTGRTIKVKRVEDNLWELSFLYKPKGVYRETLSPWHPSRCGGGYYFVKFYDSDSLTFTESQDKKSLYIDDHSGNNRDRYIVFCENPVQCGETSAYYFLMAISDSQSDSVRLEMFQSAQKSYRAFLDSYPTYEPILAACNNLGLGVLCFPKQPAKGHENEDEEQTPEPRLRIKFNSCMFFWTNLDCHSSILSECPTMNRASSFASDHPDFFLSIEDTGNVKVRKFGAFAVSKCEVTQGSVQTYINGFCANLLYVSPQYVDAAKNKSYPAV